MQLYTKEASDYKHEPIFMGKNRNVQRYDIQKYPFFAERAKIIRGLFWSPEEVNMSKDRSDYKELSPGLQHVFVSNLKYQTLLDSLMGRSLMMTVGRVVTSPEFEECLAWWDVFEVLHSKSYSHIIQGIFEDPSPIFDDILINQYITKRSQSVIQYYDALEEATDAYAVKRKHPETITKEEIENLKEKILLAIVNINILEGIRFYVSFACSFAFGENKIMIGNASILKLIATDESQHLILSQYLLKILQENEAEGFVELWNKNKEKIIDMYRVAFEEEKEWAAYLFKDESMIGLNEAILVEYLTHILYTRMSAINLPPIVEERENPIPWINNWLQYNHVETLPQETENISYTIGTLKSDLKLDEVELL
ncbi:hypothetical protein M9Y10_021674 [Tritrichomonas musculus]|uniref:Uncharacterized protein n=1 Tax=Tritrichomonas musculus TaxID=1915356 RepID=A0ABR2KQ31_9EUKA